MLLGTYNASLQVCRDFYHPILDGELRELFDQHIRWYSIRRDNASSLIFLSLLFNHHVDDSAIDVHNCGLYPRIQIEQGLSIGAV